MAIAPIDPPALRRVPVRTGCRGILGFGGAPAAQCNDLSGAPAGTAAPPAIRGLTRRRRLPLTRPWLPAERKSTMASANARFNRSPRRGALARGHASPSPRRGFEVRSGFMLLTFCADPTHRERARAAVGAPLEQHRAYPAPIADGGRQPEELARDFPLASLGAAVSCLEAHQGSLGSSPETIRGGENVSCHPVTGDPA